MSYPWNEWKRKTKKEEGAIRSLNKGRRIILDNIPNEDIVAIYVGGSFVRREMNERSDVDTWTIVRKSTWLDKLKRLDKGVGNELDPPVGISGYSLWELKTGRRTKRGKMNRANPTRFINKLDEYVLIYGNKLKIEELATKPDKENLEGMVYAFDNLFLPGYDNGELGFSSLLKQVFWLVEAELRVKGIKIPSSWRELVSSIKDKDHIIYDTFRYRLNKPSDIRVRNNYVNKLRRYLKSLDAQLT